MICFPQWPWPDIRRGRKAKPQLPTCLTKGQLLSACDPAVCGSSEAKEDACASNIKTSELWQLHSWCEEAGKRNKRGRMLNSVCPVCLYVYMISKQTSKKLCYYHDDQVHLTKFLQEDNYRRMKCYHLALRKYLSIL